MTIDALTQVGDAADSLAADIEAHSTNVFVVLDMLTARAMNVNAVYGPFRSFNAAKDWALANALDAFFIFDILRPQGVEAVGFVISKPDPPRHDLGQTEIGDYIDPTVVP